MYGVVVCPRCKRGKGVDLKQKTTTCMCGFEIHISPARVRAQVEATRDLPALVGRVNAELAGGTAAVSALEIPRPRRRLTDVHARVVAAVGSSGDRATRTRAAAVELTRELEVFSLEDWRRVLEGLGLRDPETALEALVDARVVFEPKEGFFRTVDLSL